MASSTTSPRRLGTAAEVTSDEQPQKVQITLSQGQKNVLTLVAVVIAIGIIIFVAQELSSSMADGQFD